jgi:hypothetical protein
MLAASYPDYLSRFYGTDNVAGTTDLGSIATVGYFQNALKQAAHKLNKPLLDPLQTTGIVDGGTVAATYQAAKLLGSKIPGLSSIVSIVDRTVGSIPFVGKQLLTPSVASAVWPLVPAGTRADIGRVIDTIASQQVTYALTSVMPWDAGPALPQGSAYPAGSIARQHVITRRFSIYRPLAGLGFAGCIGCELGVATPPTGYVRAGEEITLPAGVPLVGEENDREGHTFWYKNWKVWATVGGVLVAGVGTYFLLAE